jgi:polyvinyl alcohol dehydrogenase (cytochrome)
LPTRLSLVGETLELTDRTRRNKVNIGRKSIFKIGLISIAMLLLATTVWAAGGGLWTSAGQNISNTRHAKTENKISPANVSNLAVKWVFDTGGDVSATPAVDGEYVYVPDWAGNFFKIDRKTSDLVWDRQISEYTGIDGDFSRTTPAIHGDKLIFGNQGGRFFQGATFLAVDKNSGDLLWSTILDSHSAAIVTQSAIVFGDRVYVGVSSLEELLAASSYPCCTFRGSVVALDVNTGEIIWQTYTAPAISGYSGNSVWGSTPVVDTVRGSIYVTTGNNYTVPQDVLDCVAANEGDPNAIEACIAPDNYFDSILALDMDTGAVKWNTRALPFDAWTAACLFGPEENCTSPAGPNLDFGEGATLFTVKDDGGKKRELLGAGQKSGQYWALNPDTGEVVWVTKTGPGGVLGGLIWGSAVDGNQVYVANANSAYSTWTLVGGEIVNSGFWSALDAATGEIAWQTPAPAQRPNLGPVTVANGVVYACSMDVDGHMYAMDASTGVILWSFASGGSCNAGAAVVNGTVYWGSGYASIGTFLGYQATGNNKLYAFEPSG